MKTLIVGLPHFTKKIVSQLKKYNTTDTFIRLNTYYNTFDKLRFLYHIKHADTIYSINGATHGSKVLDMAIHLRKKVVLHWVGTDVTLAKKAIKQNIHNHQYISHPIHITDTPWYVDELKTIGINATFVPLSFGNSHASSLLPNQFSVLTYMSQGKETFYGINTLIDVAKELPHIEFKIMGIHTYHKPLPANIKLLGWIKNVSQEYNNSVAFLRIPKHDGLSFSVIEALGHGRYVLYNQKFDHTFFVKETNAIIQKIAELYTRFIHNKLSENHDGASFVEQDFSEEKNIKNILSILQNHHE